MLQFTSLKQMQTGLILIHSSPSPALLLKDAFQLLCVGTLYAHRMITVDLGDARKGASQFSKTAEFICCNLVLLCGSG